ncbi:hypothetical protein E0H73_25460 [Kribbella pittospori]|uniref:DUF7674 domain-containing protein n=1 Tax=Kribbella pittospori TaxID=722689 RepID=A0A4R0KFA9_9ACTN|nr:hypothetical protein [Kribbella pittospori]TCC58669.1 hypothetical protein E0H73_25460 [Kribbella pittospori]
MAALSPLQPKLRAHVEKYGSALPHTFMDDVTDEAVRLFRAGQVEAILPLLDFLESEFGADEYIDNVIALSFVDSLPGPGEPGADIETSLPPKLRGELERHRHWSAPGAGG